jgi:hypothetical protein
MGLLAELGTRTYFESQGKRTYIIREKEPVQKVIEEELPQSDV